MTAEITLQPGNWLLIEHLWIIELLLIVQKVTRFEWALFLLVNYSAWVFISLSKGKYCMNCLCCSSACPNLIVFFSVHNLSRKFPSFFLKFQYRDLSSLLFAVQINLMNQRWSQWERIIILIECRVLIGFCFEFDQTTALINIGKHSLK